MLFYLCKMLKMQTNLYWLPGAGWVGSGREKNTVKRQNKSIGGNIYVHYDDGGDVFMSIYICQNLPHCTL